MTTESLERLLRPADVISRIGYKRASFWNMVKAGKFPKGLLLPGGRARVWPESQVNRWIINLIASQSEGGAQ